MMLNANQLTILFPCAIILSELYAYLFDKKSADWMFSFRQY